MALFRRKDKKPSHPEVPEGWKTLWDKKLRKYQYINLKTKKTQWEMPKDGVDLGAPPPYSPTEDARNPGYTFNSNTSSTSNSGGPNINAEGIDRIVDAVFSSGIIPNNFHPKGTRGPTVVVYSSIHTTTYSGQDFSRFEELSEEDGKNENEEGMKTGKNEKK